MGGVDVRQMDPHELMDQVAFVFQSNRLFRQTLADNVRAARPDATDDEVLAALFAAQCDDIVAKLPQGIHTLLGSGGAYLSGGEVQRVALARAILKDAPIVVLDEATAFADPENEALIQRALTRLAAGRTVIMIAHRLSTVVGADKIVVLDRGRVAESGPHQELLSAGGLYARMWADYERAASWKISSEAAGVADAGPRKEARPDARRLQGEVPALRQRLCRHEARHLLDDRDQPRDHGRHRLSLLRHGWLRGAPHRRRRAAEPAGRRAWPRRLCRGPLPLQLAAVQQHVLRFYRESGQQRIGIAERLRKLPLSFFGRRDLADLTETIMGDVQTMEHAYSHVLGELWGAVISTSIVFVGSLFFCWQLGLAAFWSVPVAFAMLFASRGPLKPLFEANRAQKVRVTEAIQETLDCVREIRATDQEGRYLEGLFGQVDRCERVCAKGELTNGLVVNGAYAVLRLGIATTVAAGASLVAAGQVGLMTLFAFLLMVTRIYAPFDQALALSPSSLPRRRVPPACAPS